jgi:hypothetical protein
MLSSIPGLEVRRTHHHIKSRTGRNDE